MNNSYNVGRYRWVKVSFIVAAINFVWFLVESLIAGGDGVNGTIRDGRCFLSSHGKLTEVSCLWWEWSRLHAISVLVTHPLAILAGMAGWLYWRIYDRS